MIFGDKSYFKHILGKCFEFFQNSTMHRGQIHYPYVMFGMKTATKLDCYKNVSDKYFFPFFFCINLLINLSPVQNYNFFFLNPLFLLLNCQVHKWCHWFWKKKKKLLIFNIKVIVDWNFFYFYHSLGHVKD